MAVWVMKLSDIALNAEWTEATISILIERTNPDTGVVTKTISKSFSVNSGDSRAVGSEKEFLNMLIEEASKMANFARNAKQIENDYKGKVIGSS